MRTRTPNSHSHISSQAGFLTRYGITKKVFLSSGLDWRRLQVIYQDYFDQMPYLMAEAESLSRKLQLCPLIEAVSYRVKDPEHVIEKIIRKSASSGKPYATPATYLNAMTDLVGLRALLIFKEDWPQVNNFIVTELDVAPRPSAIVHPNDPKDLLEMYEANGCSIEQRDTGYRSIHYAIRMKCRKRDLFAELQVRTLFEHAWAQIVHRIEYPYRSGVPLLRALSSALSERAGEADDAASIGPILVEMAEIYRTEPRDARRRALKLRRRLREKLEASDRRYNTSILRVMLSRAEGSAEVLKQYMRARPD